MTRYVEHATAGRGAETVRHDAEQYRSSREAKMRRCVELASKLDHTDAEAREYRSLRVALAADTVDNPLPLIARWRERRSKNRPVT